MRLCNVWMNIALLLICFNGSVVSVWWLVQLMVFQPALLGSALDEMIVTVTELIYLGSFWIMKTFVWNAVVVSGLLMKNLSLKQLQYNFKINNVFYLGHLEAVVWLNVFFPLINWYFISSGNCLWETIGV